jgi:hypothetical protein
MAGKRPDTWRPTPQHELLVRAAIEDGERARMAWAQWIASVDMEKLDVASRRILPLLYRNLQRLGVEHPQMSNFSRSYRHAWAHNQVAMRHLEQIVDSFEKQGISTMLLKGAALIVRYYPDLGTRPMADFDLLVPVPQTDAAIALLNEQGWHTDQPLKVLSTEKRAPFHGIGFFHENKAMGCDLHWHIMHIHLSPIYDAPMWEAAVPVKVGNTQTRALCPEHQLIHLFFNGCVNEGGANMRWLADALVVLKKEPIIHWDRLVAQCQLLEFVRPVAAMLNYLRTTWDVPVPVETIETLAHTPVSYRMRKVFECLNTPKNERSGWQIFWLLYTQYQIARPQASRFFPFGFVQFLAHRWSLDGVGRAVNYAFLRLRGVTAEKASEIA